MRLSKVLVTNMIGLLAFSSASHFNAAAAEPAPFAMSPFQGADSVTSLLGMSPLSQLVPQGGTMPEVGKLLDPSYVLTYDPLFSMSVHPLPLNDRKDVELLIAGGVSFPNSNWKSFVFNGARYRWRAKPAAILASRLSADARGWYETPGNGRFESGFSFYVQRLTLSNSRIALGTPGIEVQKLGRSNQWEKTGQRFANSLKISGNPLVTNMYVSWKGEIFKAGDMRGGDVTERDSETLSVSGRVLWPASARVGLCDYHTKKELSFIELSSQSQNWDWIKYTISSAMTQDTFDVLKLRWGR